MNTELQTEAEEVTLQEDLLEASEKIFHREVTNVQIEIFQKRVHYYKGLEAWAQEQLQIRPNSENLLRQQSIQHMHAFDKNAQWELGQQIKRLLAEMAQRNKALLFFCATHERS